METVLNIASVTRIEGHARIAIHLDDQGNVEDTFLHTFSPCGALKNLSRWRPAEGTIG